MLANCSNDREQVRKFGQESVQYRVGHINSEAIALDKFLYALAASSRD